LSAQTDEDADLSRIPQRPVGQVYDQARWFTAEEKETVQNELGRLFTENDIDIYLVTLKKIPPQGAETFARTLGEAWARSPVWCIVFQVPGDPDGFHVEAGGEEIDRGLIDQTLKEAIQRARRENTEKERVMAAWKECSEGLRFLHAASMRYNEKRVVATDEYLANQRQGKFRRWVLIALSAVGLLFLLAVFVFIVFRIKAKRCIFIFPETSWNKRFLGPHSGGSGIVVNYRRKKLK
jgi:uncharacterized membrane protein YgcG